MSIRLRTAAIATALVGAAALPASAFALNVFVASSLQKAFPAIDSRPTYNAAGSDALATQIRQGAPADVFASANLSLPTALYKEHRCTKPVVFATNTLVLVTPNSNPAKIRSVYDLGRGRKKHLVMGTATVPIGIYTRQTLKKLGLFTKTFRLNHVSQVANVSLVKAAVIGGADAGFVYYSDWKADSTKLKRFLIRKSAQPPVKYGICIVRRTGADTAGAKKFITRVRSAAGRTKLRAFGFGVPRV